MTERVKAEALHPFARLVEVDRYFDFNLNLFSFPLLCSHYLDIGGCENASLNGSWILLAAPRRDCFFFRLRPETRSLALLVSPTLLIV
jgi:hypothetical protein